jgi:threonine dehydratase
MRSSTGSDSAPDQALDLPSAADVRAAARRLAGYAVVTPLLEADALNERIGGRLLIKAEPLQRTGAFKFRGAYNRIAGLDQAQRQRGVVAYSSGNHAQAVAAAAKLFGVPATIVMPKDAPAVKIAGTRRYGAELVLYERNKESREAIGAALAAESGATLVKPYDDFHVIAGQGTVGLEIAELTRAQGVTPDLVVVPAGGGGLMAGCALALAEALPGTSLYTAEPAGYHDHALSFAAGKRVPVPDPTAASLCDALVVPEPGELTFAINRPRVAGGLVVDDQAVAEAMAVAFRELKLVLEPGGAVALAAVLQGVIDCRDKCVVVVASGGNVDATTYWAVLERAADG